LRGARSATLRAEERLRRAEEAGEPIVQLKEGGRIHRVAQSDILFARGADDYCEVRLKDGRDLLVTTNLARLHEALPQCLVRVHKSYGVNPAEAQSVQPRPGGGRQISLSDGTTIPVGRSYAKLTGLE
jgi:DNA-binding LytR/AlgR family response regulator